MGQEDDNFSADVSIFPSRLLSSQLPQI